MKKEKSQAEVLQSIKEVRNREIAGMDASYEDRMKIQVQKVMFLGKGQKSGMDFYIVIEEDARKESPKIFLKYYDKENNLLGVQIMQESEARWLPLEGKQGELWDILREDMERCVEERAEQLQQLVKELGIKEEEIEHLSEVELEQRVNEKVDKISDKEDLKEESKDDNELGKDENKLKEKDKEELELTEEEQKQISNTNGVKEVSTSKKMDERGNSLGKLLDLEEYDGLMVVYSEKLSEVQEREGTKSDKSNSSYAILGVKYEGGKKVVERITSEKLQLYRGYNDTSIRFDDNGEVIKDEKTTARFVNPKTHRGIAIERTPHELKAYYQTGKSMDNTAVMERIEDNHTGQIPVEVKEVFNQNKGYRHIDNIDKETDLHKGENSLDREDADGDFATQECDHLITPDDKILYDGKIRTVEEVASLSRFKISAKDFCNKYNEFISKSKSDEKNVDLEEIYTNIEEQVNEEARGNASRKH